MIKMPSLDEQTMYDAETTFNLTMTKDRLAKFVAHYEVIKMVLHAKSILHLKMNLHPSSMLHLKNDFVSKNDICTQTSKQ